jgi:superfamily II DNA or RNA helicase
MKWNPEYALRDYQQDWCRKVNDGFKRGPEGKPISRGLATAGTGAGKTIMASALIYSEQRQLQALPSLFLADRDELVGQAADKIFKTTGVFADIEKGSGRASDEATIVVGSIQTISRPERLARFDPSRFGLIVCDEAHLSLADNWQRTLKHFDTARILGITATPARSDKKRLLDFYEAELANIGLFDLINLGALAPITVQTIGIEIDATRASLSDSEDNDELAEAVEPYWDAIIDAWEAHARDRPTLIFHPSRKASRAFTERLQARGVRAAHIDGSSKNRPEILQSFTDGRIEVLNNAVLLTTGYDEPRISCIINLRPTQSKTMYQQIVGRGTRLCPGKDDLLLLDFLWQFASLGVMRPADLIADSQEQRDAVQKALERGEKQLNLQEIDEAVMGEREQAMVKALKAAKRHGGRVYDARAIAAVCHIPALVDYEPLAPWEHKEASEKQVAWLEKHGIDATTIKGRGHAKAIMDEMMNRFQTGRATIRQTVTLAQMQVADPWKLSIQEASELIDRKFSERSNRTVGA